MELSILFLEPAKAATQSLSVQSLLHSYMRASKAELEWSQKQSL